MVPEVQRERIVRSLDPALVVSIERAEARSTSIAPLGIDPGSAVRLGYRYGSDHRIGAALCARSTREGVTAGITRLDAHDVDALEALVTAAFATIESRPLHLWLADPSDEEMRLLQRLGFESTRVIEQLRISLPLSKHRRPHGISVRSFEPGADEERWIELNNRTFATHPDQSTWTLEDLERRRREQWFDNRDFLLAEQDGALVGFCWTKRHLANGGEIGEIFVIGVDPNRHGSGLGRFLTCEGLSHLSGTGSKIGMLYVESTNDAARALYRHLGFERHHEDRRFTRAS